VKLVLPQVVGGGVFSPLRRRRCYLRSYTARLGLTVRRVGPPDTGPHTQARPRTRRHASWTRVIVGQQDPAIHACTHTDRIGGSPSQGPPILRASRLAHHAQGGGSMHARSSHSRITGSHRPGYELRPPRPRDFLPRLAEAGVVNPASSTPRVGSGGRSDPVSRISSWAWIAAAILALIRTRASRKLLRLYTSRGDKSWEAEEVPTCGVVQARQSRLHSLSCTSCLWLKRARIKLVHTSSRVSLRCMRAKR